jgi:two-component system sensor histidine kinase UhpB
MSSNDVHTEEPVKADQPLRLLIVNKDDAGAEVMIQGLKRAGWAVTFVRVENLDTLASRIREEDDDVVLSKHDLHDWTGMDALNLVTKSAKKVPFIVITSSLGDEVAVNYIKLGASDYALEERLDCLPSAVERVRHRIRMEKEKSQLQEKILRAKRDWEMTFDAVPDPVLLLDEDRRILRANRAAEMLGFQLSELLGRSCDEILRGGRDAPLTSAVSSQHLSTRFDLEEPRIGRFFDVTSTPVSDSLRGSVRRVVVLRDITARKQVEGRLRCSEEQLRALAARLHTSAEHERLRIARELHDQLGQALTGIKMDLDWAIRKHADDSGQLAGKVRAVMEQVDSIVGLVRKLSTELRPGMLDTLGLNAALEWLAEDFQRRSEIKCSVQVPQDRLSFSPEHEIAIFRICQEALTNIARHAGASSVSVILTRHGDDVVFTVEDDGRGFNTEILDATKSLGLAGMRERALLFGGDLQVHSSPGHGARVTLRVHLSQPSLREAGAQ